MPDEALAALAADYWDAVLEANPTSATLLGDHRFDDRIEDFSAAAEAALRGRWASMLGRLEAVDTGSLDVDERVTQQQLAGELGDALAAADHHLVELQSDQMTGFHVDLL